MPRDRSADLLNDILAFIERIESWTPPNPTTEAGVDEKTLYAVLHALQYIGEAVSPLGGHEPGTTGSLAEDQSDAQSDRSRLCRHRSGGRVADRGAPVAGVAHRR
jgi:hypothetical protein